MRTHRFLGLALLLCGLVALFAQNSCGKCTPGDPSSYRSCTVDDGYAHSAQCQPGQLCAPLVPGSVANSHCLNDCHNGCSQTEFCQPVGLGPGCGHYADQDAGTDDAGTCKTFRTCQANICQ